VGLGILVQMEPQFAHATGVPAGAAARAARSSAR
jgi:hypothetical protein